MHPLILASASPRRKALLEQIGVFPQLIVPAHIDETPHAGELPTDYVRRMARQKAQVVATQYPQSRVLAADTVVACGRRILPKAEDATTARECLMRLSGRRHRVLTAATLMLAGGGERSVCVMTMVKFRRLDMHDVAWYLATGEWDGKAGGYAIQGAAQAFIERINGSYSAVVGLPLCEVRAMLTR